MANVQLAILKLSFGCLNIVAPNYAARLSEKLFMTPTRHKLRKNEALFLESASRFDIQFNDDHLVGYKWGKDGNPRILVVHGWSSNAAAYVDLVPRLIEQGYQVIGYDAPAHGNSSGMRAMLTVWADSVRVVLDEIGEVEAIVGHSLGGAGVLIASKLDLPTKKIVLISPLGDITWASNKFASVLGISQKVIKKMRENAWSNYRQSASKYGRSWAEVFDSNYRVPSLIIHDKDDKEIAWEQSEAIASRWSWAKFVTTNRLGHRRILHDDGVLNEITEFIGQSA